MDELKIKDGLKDFFCNSLGIEPDALDFETPLFSDGIGLDSIDSLEIISYVDSTYNISMTGVGKEHFYNINAIAAYIVANS